MGEGQLKKEQTQDSSSVMILQNALRGIAANATHCPSCKMCREVAQEALDGYAQDR